MHLVKQEEMVLETSGLIPHRQKTTIVPPGGRKILLGVTVDTGRPRLTKAFRNNIETHLYALNHESIALIATARNADSLRRSVCAGISSV
jgi:RNA-directed DNA polymerase